MERTLQILNELEQQGVLGRHAIGGAVAAIFYMEPLLTYDLDIFTVLPRSPAGLLDLQPLYAELATRGYVAKGDTVQIKGVPVQFIPAYNPLLEEALAEAQTVEYGLTPTRVLRPEHLLAIMLQTARPKDRQRFVAFREQVEMDPGYLQALLARHELETRWGEWTN